MKYLVGIIVGLVGLVGLFAPAALAADANFGQCHPSADQAPGQTGNGPLTLVNGTIIVPTAFNGGQGCYK